MTEPRRILITGASRGLGRALVESFAAAGHAVAGCARDGRRIDELASRLGPPHRFDAVDVADDGAVRAWAEAVLADFGTPELLINNAATINRNARLWNVPAAEFDLLLRVNLGGVANVLRHFLPAMIGRGTGVVVNLSSYWGRSTSPDVAPYCATKWGIEGLTQALSQELPPGMAAVAVNPGIIDTEMLRECFGDDAAHYPPPRQWAAAAAPFLLNLGAKDNGTSPTVPGQ